MSWYWLGRAIRVAAFCAAGLTIGVEPAQCQATPGKGAPVTTAEWEWEPSGYLGNWKATLSWPELARCWQRYGGDATQVASSAPPGHTRRPIPLKVFPRHADFDRKRLVALRSGPYPEQLAALARLESGAEAAAERVLDGVHGYFLDHDYASLVDEVWNDEGQANIARLGQRETIGETLQLESIHVHNKWRDGLSYVGLIFSTGWDDGHGLGVLLHGDRVVQVGGADTAARRAPGALAPLTLFR